jgi:hypothetical protein
VLTRSLSTELLVVSRGCDYILVSRCLSFLCTSSLYVEEVRDNMRIRLRAQFGYPVQLNVLHDLDTDSE